MSKKTNKIFQESTTIKDGKGRHSLSWITDFNEGGKAGVVRMITGLETPKEEYSCSHQK